MRRRSSGQSCAPSACKDHQRSIGVGRAQNLPVRASNPIGPTIGLSYGTRTCMDSSIAHCRSASVTLMDSGSP